MVRIILWLMIGSLALQGKSESAPFYTLVEPLEKSVVPIEKLSRKTVMEPHRDMIGNFLHRMEATLAAGKALSGEKKADPDELKRYLKDLRELSKTKEQIDLLYRKSLNAAMAESDKQSFEELVSIPLEPLHHPRTRSEVIAFYQKHYPRRSIDSIESLCEEEELESRSLQIAIEQELAYEEHLRILKRSEVAKIKKTAEVGSRNSVIVSAEMNAHGGVEFEAENLNPYTVTMSLDFASMDNLKAPVRLPIFVEIPGKSRKKVLELSRISPQQGVSYRSSYGWVRGSAFAVHNDSYTYALPFPRGANVFVSQGYNGGMTHKGLSAYAIDFPVPIGTPIHAAREGIVVGAKGSGTVGGMSPEYRQYANYVIIEHSDGTMGNYYHLKQGGAAVRIGQKVSKGELIGYSGNTGYSSGPHLHFSVSKVDPVSMRRPMNLPVRIQAGEGIVTLPRKGDRYTVQ
ncbi:MAG: M23 family metallopeptidase [Campylobacterales bacterium]|nr:M23 family metallopeptidase [Campylobacterales bacterium]